MREERILPGEQLIVKTPSKLVGWGRAVVVSGYAHEIYEPGQSKVQICKAGPIRYGQHFATMIISASRKIISRYWSLWD